MKTETLNVYSGFSPISHFNKLHITFIIPHTSPSRIRRKSTKMQPTNIRTNENQSTHTEFMKFGQITNSL